MCARACLSLYILRLFKDFHYSWNKSHVVGRDSSVGIATRYGLDGQGIETREGGEIFRTRPDRPWDLTSLLCNAYRVSLLWLKRPGRDLTHRLPSSAEV
jgi:hypothetical protein